MVILGLDREIEIEIDKVTDKETGKITDKDKGIGKGTEMKVIDRETITDTKNNTNYNNNQPKL